MVICKECGKKIRFGKRFSEGTNVDFYEVLTPQKIALRTYERGVEDETLACGTGALAAAISFRRFHPGKEKVEVLMPGGLLEVELRADLSCLFLSGKVKLVFKGTI